MHQSEPSILKRSGGYYFYLGKRAWNLMDFQTLTYAQRNLREPLSPPCQREEACNEIHSVSTRLRHQMCGGRCIKSNLPLTFCEASRWPLHVTCGSLNSFFFLVKFCSGVLKIRCSAMHMGSWSEVAMTSTFFSPSTYKLNPEMNPTCWCNVALCIQNSSHFFTWRASCSLSHGQDGWSRDPELRHLSFTTLFWEIWC